MFLLKTPGCFDVEHPGVFCQNIPGVFVADIGLYDVYNDDIQYPKQVYFGV